MKRPRLLASVCAACALLVACTGVPQAPTTQPARGSPHAGFEQQELSRAEMLASQGHLAEAAVSWELLTVLRPDVPAYRERLAQTRAQIERAAAEQMAHARQAQIRGAWDDATQHYLAALALRPDDTAAADALRAIERERNKRFYLGRYSRLTLASRAGRNAARSDGEAANALSAERNDLEHAALLAGQGEFDAAIDLLTPRLKASPKDGAARELLADVYFHKAQTTASRDKAKAIAALEKCLQLDPRHGEARALLGRLRPNPRAPQATPVRAPVVAPAIAPAVAPAVAPIHAPIRAPIRANGPAASASAPRAAPRPASAATSAP